MSKPEDIPQDVWAKAEDTLDTMLSNHGYEGWRADSIATIARAILAAKAEEREACALLLDEGFEREGVKHKNDECSHGRFGYEDCEQCASAAIRKRGEG